VTFVVPGFRFVLGEDVFISYSRKDASTYAATLANQLTDRGFSCFLDQWDTQPGETIPTRVLRALKRSSLLALVGSAEGVRSAAVEHEVETFLPTKRPLVPISVDGALEVCEWFDLISGASVSAERASRFAQGSPSELVLNRIQESARFTKRNTRARRAFVIATVMLLALAGTAVWTANEARRSADEARHQETVAKRNAVRARAQLADAVVAQGDAAASIGRFPSAYERYVEADAILAEISASQMPAELGVLDLLRNWRHPLRTIPIDVPGVPVMVAAQAGQVVLASGDGPPALWNLYTGTRTATFDDCQGIVLSLAVGRDGQTIALGTRDGELSVCGTGDGAPSWSAKGHRGSVTALALDAKRRRLVSGGEDGLVRQWNLDDGQVLATWKEHEGSTVLGISISPDGRLVASTSGRLNAVSVRDMAAGTEPVRWWDEAFAGAAVLVRDESTLITQGPRGVASWKLDGTNDMPSRVASTSVSDSALFWDYDRPREGAVLSPRGHYIAESIRQPVMVSLSEQEDFETLKVLRLNLDSESDEQNSSPSLVLPGVATSTLAVAFSHDERQVVTVEEGALRVWDLEPRKNPSDHLSNRFGQILSSFSGDGRLVASSTGEGDAVGVWDVESGQLLASFSDFVSRPTAAALSPSAQLLAVGEENGKLVVFQLTSGRRLNGFQIRSEAIRSLAFSGDERVIVTASDDGSFGLWDPIGGVRLRQFGCDSRAALMSLSRDGTRTAATCEEGWISVWDAATGKIVARLEGNTGPELAFSSDGERLAYGSAGVLRVVEVDSSRVVAEIENAGRAHYGLGFMADDEFLVSASPDRYLKVWSIDGARQIRAFRAHHEGGLPLVVAPGGQRVLSNGAYGQILLWDFVRPRAYIRLLNSGGPSAGSSRTGFAGSDTPATELRWFLQEGRCDWALAILSRRPATLDELDDKVSVAGCYWSKGMPRKAKEILTTELAAGRIPEVYATLWIRFLSSAR
jgi:WD40 repeat protein